MRTAAILTLLVAVPALAPAQDGDEAKKLFEAMEERLAKAKSVNLGFSVESELGGKPLVKLKGSLAFAEGDRARLETEGTIGGEERKIISVSDGKRARKVTAPPVAPEEHPTRKNLTGALARALSRAGILRGWSPLLGELDSKQELKSNDLFPVSDFKSGGRGKVGNREAQVLTYKVVFHPDDPKMEVTVWIDPLTHLPLKRVLRSGEGEGEITITELYTGIRTDEKLDPKQFNLPK